MKQEPVPVFVFINFNEDQYVAHYPNDIRFGIM